MLKSILSDFAEGLFYSMRIDLVCVQILNDVKLEKIVTKIGTVNMYLYILPLIIKTVIEYTFGICLFTPFVVINFLISLFSLFFHIIHYTDLVKIVSKNTSKTKNDMNLIDAICIAVTMIVYQLVICIISFLADVLFYFLFANNFHFLSYIVNYTMNCLYHSFFCYNNLWHYKKIGLGHRVDIIEKMWPYYLGYGLIATILYIHSSNAIIAFIYNTYLMLIISLPFLSPSVYPKKQMPYPKINLKIFSYASKMLVRLCDYVTN